MYEPTPGRAASAFWKDDSNACASRSAKFRHFTMPAMRQEGRSGETSAGPYAGRKRQNAEHSGDGPAAQNKKRRLIDAKGDRGEGKRSKAGRDDARTGFRKAHRPHCGPIRERLSEIGERCEPNATSPKTTGRSASRAWPSGRVSNRPGAQASSYRRCP